MFQFIGHFLDRFTGKVLLGQRRSSQWPRVRKEYLAEHPTCECCGRSKRLEVHHCVPFSWDNTKELLEDNLLTLCRNHHYFIGHLMDWKSFNQDVIIDSKAWKEKIQNRPIKYN